VRKTGLRKIVLVAATAAAAMTAPVHGATQTGRTSILLPGYSTASAAIRLATAVCGGNGCYAVQTKQNPRHTKFKPLGHG